MSKRKLRIIISLMAMAMLALIAYQVYWIDNAIQVNEIQFRQHVHEALIAVSGRLEKNEVYITARERFGVCGGRTSFNSPDSNAFIRQFYYEQYAPRIRNPYTVDSEKRMPDLVLDDSVVLGDQHIHIRYEVRSNFPNTAPAKLDTQMRMGPGRFELNVESHQRMDKEIRKSIQKIAQKSEMVTVVLDEMFNPQPEIENRIHKEQLMSMLDTELSNRGIDLDYEYAVIDRQHNHFVFSDFNPDEQGKIFDSDYSVKLFPNDLHGNDYFLSVFFPDKTRFLLKKVWFNLTSSFLLVFLIISLFTYAIFAIVRQKKVSEIKNDFINNMTHEFKTPISTISLACEALQDPGIKHSKSMMDNYINMVRTENNRLTRQVEKVLQMATLDKKEYKLNIDEIDLHLIIENAIRNISIQVEKKGGRIDRNLIAENHMIFSDEVHLTNIIYNLLDNANKYSLNAPEIQIETADHHQGVLIRIIDQGMGMTKEAQDKIFDKFYRVPTGNRHDVKGFGLGLAYVKTMLDVLGGKIRVNSNPGEGSVFSIILPIHPHGSN